jgi:ATP-dependent protease HslVU (ClpYQ) peptidase subunit
LIGKNGVVYGARDVVEIPNKGLRIVSGRAYVLAITGNMIRSATYYE